MAGWGDYETQEQRALRGISDRAAKPSKDLQKNLGELNNSVRYMSQMMTIMQNGIDDANRDILQKIRDAIQELIIIFNGGDLSNLDFEWGDLKYVLQAIGQFFGFPNWGSDIWSPQEMVQNFFNQFLSGLFDFDFSFLKQAFEGHYTGTNPGLQVVNSVIGSLQGGFTSVQNIVNQIMDILRGIVVTPINSAIAGVKDWFENLVGWRSNTTDNVTAASNTAVAAKGTADVANTVAVYTTFNVTSNKPLWQALDPTAEVSFPWADLAYDNGGSINTVAISQNVARFAKLRIGNDQVMNTYAFLAYKSGTVTALYADLYKYRESDSGWDLVYSSTNLGVDLTTAWAKLQYIMSVAGLPFTAGDKYALQFRMVGSGTVYLAGKNFPVNFIPGFEPEVMGASRDPYTTPAPALITNAQMDTYNDSPVPYVEIGSNVGQVGIPRSWYVNFNNSSWNGWIRQHYAANGQDLRITSGVVEYGGTTDGYQYAHYAAQTATDDMEVQIYFNRSAAIRSAIGICMDNTGMGGLVMAVDSSGIYFSKQNSLGSFSQKASFTYSSGAGTYKFRYVSAGNYFIAYKLNPIDGTWVAVTDPWYDTSNEILHGPGRRFGSIVMNRGFFQTGAGMDDFYLRDWNV